MRACSGSSARVVQELRREPLYKAVVNTLRSMDDTYKEISAQVDTGAFLVLALCELCRPIRPQCLSYV